MEEVYMNMALHLAKLGEGFVNPNPLVGAIIVKNGRVIGEGYHKKYGENHAEMEALKSCKEDVKGAEMYVTLEPCSHEGKTPSCAKAIVKTGIKKVNIAMLDPNPLVSGKGVKILRENNIQVEVGILENQARKLNEIFIKYITTKKPFCILKSAITMDGKIATSTGDSMWVTGEESREYVHKIRNRVSAIMVGINTVINDNPSLTTRLKGKVGKNPIRVIVDSTGKIPLNSKIFNEQGENIIAVTSKASEINIKNIEKQGAKVIVIPESKGKVDLKHLMKVLGQINIDSVLLEGGGTLNYSAIMDGVVDKVMCFMAPKIIGGENAKTFVQGEGIKNMKDAIKLKKIDMQRFSDDILIEGYI